MFLENKNFELVLGMNPSNVHASLFNAELPDFVSVDEIDFDQIDLVISGLPHDNLLKD